EISKIITIGGVVLYAYGVRPLNDVDAIMVAPKNPELEQLMYDNFQNPETKFDFADMGIEGKYWKSSWSEKNKEILDYFKIDSIAELVCNPRYHMFYQGLKLYLFDHEIVRKLFRCRAQDLADFIYMLLFRRELVSNFISIDDKTKRIIFKNFEKRTKLPSVGKIIEQVGKKYPSEKVRKVVNSKLVSTLVY
ncbi:MAG: glycosyltransferase, partial [Hyperionvirus sp.]